MNGPFLKSLKPKRSAEIEKEKKKKKKTGPGQNFIHCFRPGLRDLARADL